MGRRAVLLLVAALIAAGGTALVLLYVQGIDARATADQAPVKVLTATVRIERGETLAAAQAAGKVDLVEWPKVKVLPGALGSVQGLEKKTALTTIFPGEQIISEKFGAAAERQLIDIPDGKMAISVQLSDPARVAGFVTPGSDVAIFLHGKPTLMKPGGSSTPLPDITKLLLRKVEVIGVGHTTVRSSTTTTAEGTETTEQIPTTILTLAVTQEEAEKVILATNTGQLSFGLLTEKSKTSDSKGTVLTDIYGDSF